MKVTQTQIREYLKTKLATDSGWALRGLERIWENQTQDEKASMQTRDHNGVGFSGCDAEILTSFVQQYHRRGQLSPKQMQIVHKKMPRYWKQILDMISEDKLNQLKVKISENIS